MRSTRPIYLLLTIAVAALAVVFFHDRGAMAQGDVTAETGYRKLAPPEKYGTILMQRTTRESGEARPVLFPHWSHRLNYTCSVCHTDLGVPMKAGESALTHGELDAGESCGACHDDTTAFSTERSCDRCHSYGIEVEENTDIHEALADLPEDPFGNQVDWSAAVRDAEIAPSAAIGAYEELDIRDTEIIIKPSKFKPHPPDVLFPHEPHSRQIRCETCHPTIFKDVEGGNPEMSMKKFMAGEYCGVCHGRVSFPLGDCFRCHSQPAPEPEEEDN